MGYIEIKPTITKIVTNGKVHKFYNTKSNRGRFLGNIALTLFPDSTHYEDDTITILLPPEGEQLFNEIVENAKPTTSANSIIRFILLTWDTIKKYGYDDKITLEDLLRLYI